LWHSVVFIYFSFSLSLSHTHTVTYSTKALFLYVRTIKIVIAKRVVSTFQHKSLGSIANGDIHSFAMLIFIVVRGMEWRAEARAIKYSMTVDT
jgi:hypothetical protein